MFFKTCRSVPWFWKSCNEQQEEKEGNTGKKQIKVLPEKQVPAEWFRLGAHLLQGAWQQGTVRQSPAVLPGALWEAGCFSLQRDRDFSALEPWGSTNTASDFCCRKLLCPLWSPPPLRKDGALWARGDLLSCWGSLVLWFRKAAAWPWLCCFSLRSPRRAKRHMNKHWSSVCCDSALGLLGGHLPPWLQRGLLIPPLLLRNHTFSLMDIFSCTLTFHWEGLWYLDGCMVSKTELPRGLLCFQSTVQTSVS